MVVMGLLAILSGLAAAISWGVGDFAGGLASRRAAAVRVVLASQFIGTLALVALGLVLDETRPPTPDLLIGAVAGLAGSVGLLLLYLSLARGKMGIAAPLTAVASGGIPLFVGLATEGLPGAAQLAGFALALAAIWIIAGSDGGGPTGAVDILLPLLAGVGFGIFIAVIGRIEAGSSFVWPLMAARVASMSLMAVVLLLTRRKSKVAGDEAAMPWGLAAVAGLGDTAGNAFLILSAQVGRLDVAAVLGALYPAATVLLARTVLGERLTPRQNAGVGLALAAVLLIAL